VLGQGQSKGAVPQVLPVEVHPSDISLGPDSLQPLLQGAVYLSKVHLGFLEPLCVFPQRTRRHLPQLTLKSERILVGFSALVHHLIVVVAQEVFGLRVMEFRDLVFIPAF